MAGRPQGGEDPDHASQGDIEDQRGHRDGELVEPWLRNARTSAQPKTTPPRRPSRAPNTEITNDSSTIMPRTAPRPMPTARSSPSSRVRSTTDSASVFTMPNAAIVEARSPVAGSPSPATKQSPYRRRSRLLTSSTPVGVSRRRRLPDAA